MTETIAPHGGVLIDRELKGKEKEEALERARHLKTLCLTDREVSDLEMIAAGALSPLQGFMTSRDYQSVLKRKSLEMGLPWTIPIVKQITQEEKAKLRQGEEVVLEDKEGNRLALFKVEEIFPHDKKEHALLVYGTEERAHPGVDQVYQMGDFLAGGEISLLARVRHKKFLELRLDPRETRALFKSKGWEKVVAFQTRNPIHRAHEYIQKCALEIVDGLLVHPLVGETKGDDISAEIRVRSYQVILEKYYPRDRVVLSVFPAAMRYAGPREAIFHAIVRKNYGCTHFIVGRDHAGVSRPGGKPFYGSFDAHKIFDEFDPGAIGITPLFFDYTFYCRVCQGMASFKTCPHDPEHHLNLSGSKVREMLARGEVPPVEFTRTEVAQVLMKDYSR